MNDKALVKIFFSSEEEHPEHISEVSIKKALPLDKRETAMKSMARAVDDYEETLFAWLT